MVKKLNSLIVLFKAHHSLAKNVKSSLIGTELTVNEFTVMEALYTKKELSTQELIDKILIPNSSMTYVLDILEKRELINRLKDPKDKRRQLISLTDEGESLFKEVYEQHYQHMQSIFSVLSDQENQELQRLLKIVGKKAEEVSNK
ncbi:MAG TPA: MarR family transcriptional regulator [Erysipelothrix sp.]|jgi:MarR family 2-MHQ and catechol resistance regulon transcriptional repressor|nr:MarR family transcriptional regulator [Erysipelothrix sp.]